MSDNLKGKMIGAVTWSSIDRFGQQAVQFVIGMILARLLSPSDFGLMGMVAVFSALSFVLIESGFGLALVRKKDANETDFNTVFYFNIGVSVFLYLVLFFTAPLIAQYFNQPLLTSLSRIIFLSILFNAFYLIPFIKLGIILDFKTIAKVNLISTGISGAIGVLLAYLNWGVWALACQQVCYHFLRMVSFYLFVKWKPSWLFSFSVIREFWKFSINILGTSVLNVLFNNLFVFLIGKYYSTKQTGYYSQSNKLSETFNFSFQAILVGSTYNLFTQIQHDDERFRRIFREIANKVSVVTFPVMISLIAMAKPLIFTLLGAKWLPSEHYFQLLCVASLFGPLYTLNINALNARGESKNTLIIEIIKKSLTIGVVIFSFQYGIETMLCGYAASNFIAYAISAWFLKKSLTHYLKHQFEDFVKSVLVGLGIAGVLYLEGIIISNNYLLFSCQLISAAGIYLLVIQQIQPALFESGKKFILEKLGKVN